MGRLELRRASSAVPPAWSMWACVCQICVERHTEGLPGRGQQPVEVAAGVDHGRLQRFVAPDDGAVLLATAVTGTVWYFSMSVVSGHAGARELSRRRGWPMPSSRRRFEPAVGRVALTALGQARPRCRPAPAVARFHVGPVPSSMAARGLGLHERPRLLRRLMRRSGSASRRAFHVSGNDESGTEEAQLHRAGDLVRRFAPPAPCRADGGQLQARIQGMGYSGAVMATPVDIPEKRSIFMPTIEPGQSHVK